MFSSATGAALLIIDCMKAHVNCKVGLPFGDGRITRFEGKKLALKRN